jgi:Excreted virulence factor EspC, type VII ESX diderm
LAAERGFAVDPEALNGLAGEFERAASGLAGAASRFGGAAQAHADAFGLLPPSRAAHTAYLARAQEGLDGLRAVHDALLHSLAGGLRVTAATYARSDEDGVAI